jgi:hypothetical protein
MDISDMLDLFLSGDANGIGGRTPDARFSSYDYCYNYFRDYVEEGKVQDISSENNVQESCLQLGFYLASWGMMRGSGFLLKKSLRSYIPVIRTIAETDSSVWHIDVDSYSDESLDAIIDTKKRLAERFAPNRPSDTLLSKIMLGVFGNVPAFDTYVRKAFGVHTFNRNALAKIQDFYKEHKPNFDSYHIKTLDFMSGQTTGHEYTNAKLIDMYGFMYGQLH